MFWTYLALFAVLSVGARHKPCSKTRHSTLNLHAPGYGTDLMRAAFEPDSGPLTDRGLPKAERESIFSLVHLAPTRTQAATAQ